jgi:hypothetical protein
MTLRSQAAAWSAGVGAAFVIASAAACNAIAGIHDPVGGDPAAPPVTPGTPDPDGGDGSTSSGGTPGADRFLGTWNSPASTLTLSNCTANGLNGPQTAPRGVVVTKGPSGLVFTPVDGATCRLNASVNGDTATLLAGQSCSFDFSDETDSYDYDATSTFKLGAGNQAQMHITARIEIDSVDGSAVCNFEENGTYTKQ